MDIKEKLLQEYYANDAEEDKNDFQFMESFKKILKKGEDEIIFLLAEYAEKTKRAAFNAGFEVGIKLALDRLKNTENVQKRPPVGGVDRDRAVDKISIQNAVETPFWLAICATEPERRVQVEMSYSDLKTFCDLLDKEWEEMHK